MKPNAVFDYTEVNFAGKQYKFLKERPIKPLPKPANRRSKSVLSPIIDDLMGNEENSVLEAGIGELKPPQSPANCLAFDLERVKRFSQLPGEKYRTAHVDLLSPQEELRVRQILKMQPKAVEIANKRQKSEVVREATDIKNVFQYFADIKQYNSARTSRLPRLQPSRRLSQSQREKG